MLLLPNARAAKKVASTAPSGAIPNRMPLNSAATITPLGPRSTTAAQVYTVHDLHPFLAGEIVKRGAARCGLTWHFCRPPVVDLEYEMDCRGVSEERVV